MAEVYRHHPTDSGHRDHRGQRMCHCGSWWDDTVHDMTGQDPAAQAEHRRRIGERE